MNNPNRVIDALICFIVGSYLVFWGLHVAFATVVHERDDLQRKLERANYQLTCNRHGLTK